MLQSHYLVSTPHTFKQTESKQPLVAISTPLGSFPTIHKVRYNVGPYVQNNGGTSTTKQVNLQGVGKVSVGEIGGNEDTVNGLYEHWKGVSVLAQVEDVWR